jgi:dihydroflavonol-4-reductase
MNSNENTLAITGATGHLGTTILLQALEKGIKVRAAFRSWKPDIQHENLSWIKGDLSVDSIRELLASANAVIHCAAKISIDGDRDGSVKQTNVQGTRNVFEACLQCPGIRIVHVSSTHAIIEEGKDELFDESRPLKSAKYAAYDYSKAESERVVHEFIAAHKLHIVIVRPSSILGLPDYRPSLLGTALLDLYKGKLPALTSGGYDFIDVQDVASSCLTAIDQGRSGETYLLTGTFHELKALGDMIRELGGARTPMIIPINCLLPLAPIVGLFSKLRGKTSPFTRESLLTLRNAHPNMSHEKAQTELNHRPREIKEVVQDLIAWWKSNNMIK